MTHLYLNLLQLFYIVLLEDIGSVQCFMRFFFFFMIFLHLNSRRKKLSSFAGFDVCFVISSIVAPIKM